MTTLYEYAAMLPPPYDDELWYSVMCRYRVHAGHNKPSETFHELFGPDRSFVTLNPYSVNPAMLSLSRDPIDTLIYHTTEPYVLRFAGLEVRHKVSHSLLVNEPIKNRPGIRGREEGLRYCPLCAKWERKHLGECYWHVSHQLPLMSLCPKHGCHLRYAGLTRTKCSGILFPAEFYIPTDDVVSRKDRGDPGEQSLCAYSYAALTASFSFSNVPPAPIPLYMDALIDHGVYQNRKFIKSPALSLYGLMCARFSKEVVDKVFDKNFWSSLKILMRKSNSIAINQYILLAATLELPIADLFPV